jgi:hypothetical protein
MDPQSIIYTIAVLTKSDIVDTASVVGSLMVIATAIGFAAKNRYLGKPVRWVFKRLVTEPITGSFDNMLETKLTAKLSERNGGSSIRDQMDDIQQAILASSEALNMHAEDLRDFKKQTEINFKQISGDLSLLSSRVGATDAHLSHIDAEMSIMRQ